ncbi:DUF1828 domain-containing protein [Lactobacillus xylocopicola]|uniref:DUF1828 domain-containing protein n=1 Tax=Lactobacillus xylocopicola TaxID=2976676 RepID=A0ABN6SN12_9LACO|nr:DUF1828 domain-containing protein [Lactobacillus xylocopicola]BDR60417.1 hypothetical protein KIM322_06780 [Lactobacillus xylocopicola]
MTKEITAELVGKALNQWMTANTHVLELAPDTLEVATLARDAMGETVYCFVEARADHYEVSDDGRCLFKLDPSASDEALYQLAAGLAGDAGFHLNAANGVLSAMTEAAELLPKIVALAQLQVVISFLQ